MYFATVDWGDLEAELEKLAMDARRTPERVLKAHLANQRS